MIGRDMRSVAFDKMQLSFVLRAAYRDLRAIAPMSRAQ
jgi:hypothetical protein